MKKLFGIIVGSLTLSLCSSLAQAADMQMGVVDVSQLFNSSSYVQKANKELQNDVKKMESDLKDEQQKLQGMINRYQKSKNADLLDQIKEAQANLTKVTQNYQQKVQTEQNSGMKKFSDFVRKAVTKVAQEKHLGTVLNSTSVVYTDNVQLIDITKEVAAEMAKGQ